MRIWIGIQELFRRFHKSETLNKIFDRNTITISSSCADNMEEIINRKVNKIVNNDYIKPLTNM